MSLGLEHNLPHYVLLPWLLAGVWLCLQLVTWQCCWRLLLLGV
jgi:hypothetical protein